MIFLNLKIIESYLKILNENSNEIFIISSKKFIKEKFEDFFSLKLMKF